MKLKCFHCGKKFEKREDIFRNSLNYPLCRDCLFEDLEWDWDDEFLDDLIDDIKNKFDGKYIKWFREFHEKNEECIGCRGKEYDKMFYPKDQLLEIDGKNYCECCIEERELI